MKKAENSGELIADPTPLPVVKPKESPLVKFAIAGISTIVYEASVGHGFEFLSARARASTCVVDSSH